MKRINIFIVAVICFIVDLHGQNQPAQPDTTSMPRLEIPEITIVGKKAITLPFARKGEIYDVNIYEAPAPDSSILEKRSGLTPPIGELPRYEEPLVPWHISAEGGLGSFSNGNLRAYVDYLGRHWGVYGNGGFRSTGGHTTNSSGSEVDGEVTAHSLVETDNDVLRSFRVSGGMKFEYDSYGMFGIQDTVAKPDRSKNVFSLNAQMGSLDRETNAIDFGISTDIISITDTHSGHDSDITAASPDIHGSFATVIDDVRITTLVGYQSSSLNYHQSIESPSLFKFSAGAQWQLFPKWYLHVGAGYFSGGGSDGVNRSLFLPFASVKWTLDNDRVVSFWYKPEMRLASYRSLFQQNPYLAREAAIRPERVPLNVGSTFWYNSNLISAELEASIANSSNKYVMLADSGIIRLHYIESNVFTIRANGTIKPSDDLKLTLAGLIQPSFEEGQSTQLPMIPVMELGGRAEYAFGFPCTVWSSLEYWADQNVDIKGTKTIDGRLLLGLGASTDAIPRTVLSLEIANVLDTKYEWWSGYEAPGISIMFNAKVNIR
jgi:hypothetical protein